MIKGVGIDIVENGRFSCPTEKFLKSIFTPYELEEGFKRCEKEEYYASRFALKEAFAKALGSGFRGFGPKDVEVREDALGRPYLKLSDKIRLEEGVKIFSSLSHEREYSVAMVVLDGTK